MTDAVPPKPPTIVELIWEHDLVLAGRSGDVRLTLDSASVEGPSSTQALAFALAGCMTMDVVHILRKGRHDLRGLKVDLTAQRAPTEPRRFTSIALNFTITGEVPADQIERAIQLSREKYCSVWHSMRQDIALSVSYGVSSGV
ncbi:MAG TPA: OsmC family protein [Vicinamibacterales bacterium]|nr:OsmC family protein [Vicinamibacterales bacterium]